MSSRALRLAQQVEKMYADADAEGRQLIVAIRAERRLALAVMRPSAFCEVRLA
jgi:hypothetical protein